MSIVIELDPDAEATIKEHAAAISMEARQYVSQWVRVLASHPELARTLSEAHDQDKKDAAISRAIQLEAMRRDIAEFGNKHQLPSLPDEALTREAIYQDHG